MRWVVAGSGPPSSVKRSVVVESCFLESPERTCILQQDVSSQPIELLHQCLEACECGVTGVEYSPMLVGNGQRSTDDRIIGGGAAELAAVGDN